MTVSVDPNFRSSLPPRKRAKTDEEKEQRRVERILRNRRAAHASREKKRKHVEYLEEYVMALESNMATLSDNYAKVKELAPADKLAALTLPKLENLSELRDRIPSNLTVPCPLTSMSGSPPPLLADVSMSQDVEKNVDFESEGSTVSYISVKKEPVDMSLEVPSTGFFNYLSPVSISSPVNSPINLTLTSNDAPSLDSDSSPNTPEMSSSHSDGLMIESATSGIDFLAQNSAVILSPKVLTVFAAPLTVLCLSFLRPYALNACINLEQSTRRPLVSD